jgi:AraC family transcriptional regulator
MLDIRVKPVESLVFGSDVIAVGKFRCAATHPLFRDSGPCSYHSFAFPRTNTAIRYDDGRAYIGGPATVGLYNQHQVYFRTRVSDVDASDWYTLADDVLLDIVARYGDADPKRPFAVAETPCESRTFIEQRMLFDALERGEAIDATQVEETMLRLLERIVAQAHRRKLEKVRVDVDAVEHVRARIASDPSSNESLRVLARSAGLSPFQLCRVFRARTGKTITHYRHSMRLHMSLDRLKDRRSDVSAIASDHGYSSHSHFTAVFRKHFGLTPSEFRARS